jgi:hypothetical protein
VAWRASGSVCQRRCCDLCCRWVPGGRGGFPWPCPGFETLAHGALGPWPPGSAPMAPSASTAVRVVRVQAPVPAARATYRRACETHARARRRRARCALLCAASSPRRSTSRPPSSRSPSWATLASQRRCASTTSSSRYPSAPSTAGRGVPAHKRACDNSGAAGHEDPAQRCAPPAQQRAPPRTLGPHNAPGPPAPMPPPRCSWAA